MPMWPLMSGSHVKSSTSSAAADPPANFTLAMQASRHPGTDQFHSHQPFLHALPAAQTPTPWHPSLHSPLSQVFLNVTLPSKSSWLSSLKRQCPTSTCHISASIPCFISHLSTQHCSCFLFSWTISSTEWKQLKGGYCSLLCSLLCLSLFEH